MQDEFDDILKEETSESESLDLFEEQKETTQPVSKSILKNSKNQVQYLLGELEKTENEPNRVKKLDKPSTATRQARFNQERKLFPAVLKPVIDFNEAEQEKGDIFLLGRRQLAELDDEVTIADGASKKIKPVDIYPDDFDSDRESVLDDPLVVKVG